MSSSVKKASNWRKRSSFSLFFHPLTIHFLPNPARHAWPLQLQQDRLVDALRRSELVSLMVRPPGVSGRRQFRRRLGLVFGLGCLLYSCLVLRRLGRTLLVMKKKQPLFGMKKGKDMWNLGILKDFLQRSKLVVYKAVSLLFSLPRRLQGSSNWMHIN